MCDLELHRQVRNPIHLEDSPVDWPAQSSAEILKGGFKAWQQRPTDQGVIIGDMQKANDDTAPLQDPFKTYQPPRINWQERTRIANAGLKYFDLIDTPNRENEKDGRIYGTEILNFLTSDKSNAVTRAEMKDLLIIVKELKSSTPLLISGGGSVEAMVSAALGGYTTREDLIRYKTPQPPRVESNANPVLPRITLFDPK